MLPHAVVATFRLDYLLPSGKSPRPAHGHHDGLGAGVREAHLLYGRHPAHDPFRELGLQLAGGRKTVPKAAWLLMASFMAGRAWPWTDAV